jgi:fatty acid desaturase
MSHDGRRARKVKNLSLAAVASLAGLSSVVIIFAALLIGVWLAGLLPNVPRGLVIVGALILSVPVSLYTMLKIVMGSVGRIIPQPPLNKAVLNEPDVEED